MKTLYVDAGYNWHNTEKTPASAPVIGQICISDGEEFTRIEKVGVGKVPVLRQYNNVFELIALARGIEIAIEKGWVGNLALQSDSKIAIGWAAQGRVKDPKKQTIAHTNALEYLRTARKNYIGIVTYNYVPREYNKAGHVLERLLEEEKTKPIAVADEKPEKINRDNITLDPYEALESHD